MTFVILAAITLYLFASQATRLYAQLILLGLLLYLYPLPAFGLILAAALAAFLFRKYRIHDRPKIVS